MSHEKLIKLVVIIDNKVSGVFDSNTNRSDSDAEQFEKLGNSDFKKYRAVMTFHDNYLNSTEM